MTVISDLRFVLPPLLVLLFLAGCATGSSPVNFYTLNALKASEVASRMDANHMTIGLGPVELPEMLDRPQIITRRGSHRLELAEFDRWAGPLRNDFTRVLAENLSVLLNTEDVLVYPWGGGVEIDYQVLVGVVRFDAVVQKNANLNARWKLREGEQGKVLKSERSVITKPIVGQGYDAVVAALNRTLNAFSREIAESIQSLERGSTLH